MDFKIPKLDELKDLKGRLDLKDRLGLKDGGSHARGAAPRVERDDAASHDEYGHEDFGEYAFDDQADYVQDRSRRGVDASDGADPAATAAFAPQMPKLVTAEDVRAHTQYTPNEQAIETTDSSGRVSAPAFADEAQRTAVLGDSFGTIPQPDIPLAEQAVPSASAKTGAFAAGSDVPAMPDRPAESAPRVIHRATRILTVIKPESYNDAERIAKILKSGDVAVLSLRDTPDALGKRILDFSFGVACALDARVECVSAHVFALTRGAGLTEGETGRLRDQGLM